MRIPPYRAHYYRVMPRRNWDKIRKEKQMLERGTESLDELSVTQDIHRGLRDEAVPRSQGQARGRVYVRRKPTWPAPRPPAPQPVPSARPAPPRTAVKPEEWVRVVQTYLELAQVAIANRERLAAGDNVENALTIVRAHTRKI